MSLPFRRSLDCFFCLAALIAIVTPVLSSSANFPQCEATIRNLSSDTAVWFDANGVRTQNESAIAGTDYATCEEHCGTSPAPFHWRDFSPSFSGWLLPFLALTAQLPFQSDGIWHDLMCLFLTIGSPQLAMYSLALTLLNSRYVKKQLDSLRTLNGDEGQLELLKKSVLQTFRFSQQEPFGLTIPMGAVTSDFVTLTHWWHSACKSLEKSARWFTASLATQSAWAMAAFAFTWVDAFGPRNLGLNVTAFGLAIALCWSWVAVIVLGWFFAGVSSSKIPMTEAIQQANEKHLAASLRLTTYTPPRNGNTALSRRISGDAERSGPLYNYARVFVWSHLAYYTIDTIRQRVNEQRRQHQIHGSPQSWNGQVLTPGTPGALGLQLLPSPSPIPGPTATANTSAQGTPKFQTSQLSVQDIRVQPPSPQPSHIELGNDDDHLDARYLWEITGDVTLWKHDVHVRMGWALACAVVLNVATVGAAFGLDFATPSTGLGCRSGGVLIYWIISYAVMILLIFSAWISDRWSVHEAAVKHQGLLEESGGSKVGYRLLGISAVLLRVLGKALAIANTVWILLHCFFEFTQFYNRCYCLTNRRTSPWLFLDDESIRDIGSTERFWGGFAGTTGVTCTIYIIFMGVWAAKRLPRS
ncbi:hypothetical protein FRC17_011208 [Serendipita sp. 399]|nr:hypothetical protein FRC17_011208 [Serendipita sp. 399]